MIQQLITNLTAYKAQIDYQAIDFDGNDQHSKEN